VLHGADDPFIPLDDVNAFKEEMAAAEVDYRFVAYPGAVHGFTNPDADSFGERFDLPLAYDAEADRASWSEMQAFFKRIFAD
jgi:dienelactone hydrolase